jgi:hypothetical protein
MEEKKKEIKKPLTDEEKKKIKKKKELEDFKRKYFDYHDDIKISDRQDW